MFTFQQTNDEFVFGNPTTYMDSTLISFAAGGDGSNLVETTSFEPSIRRRFERKSECIVKKVIHREVEKKRRQEMSSLCASLGSLLPPIQIKGKLSVCDQIQVAVDHIKETEKRIEQLRIQRDKLKKSLGLSNPKPSSSHADDNCVTVNLGAEWAEILISTPDLGLSRLHAVLAHRGFDVVSCVSTRINGRFFHKIKIELKKSLGLSNPKPSSSHADDNCITVNLGAEWAEIMISAPDLGLSRLLAVLAHRGFDLVSCVSTRINGRFFHKIKIEALYMTSLDASELQDRLRDAIE